MSFLLWLGLQACQSPALSAPIAPPVTAPVERADPGDAMLAPPLYALTFQQPGLAPTGIRVQPDGAVLSSGAAPWTGESWREAFHLDADQLRALAATLDAVDAAALRAVQPPVGDRSTPPPRVLVQLVQRGEPVQVDIPAYTPEGAPALEALHQAVQALWVGLPVSTRVELPTGSVALACDPTAVLSLRDVLFPLLDPKLPSANAAAASPQVSVEWWKGGERQQRYVLHAHGLVQRQVPGRDDEWRQLPSDVQAAVEARLGRLTVDSLKAGCPAP